MLKKLLVLMVVLAMCANCAAFAEADATDTASEAVEAETAEESAEDAGSPEQTLAQQAQIDAMLQAELEYGYSFEEPLVVINPYGWVPLSAAVIFSTPEEHSVHMTVCGDTEECNLDYDFPAATDHVLPVIGLYSGRETVIRLTLDNGESVEVTAETDAVPENIVKIERTVGDGSQLYGKLLMCESVFLDTTDGWGITGYDSEGDLRYYASISADPAHFEQLEDGRWVTLCDHLIDYMSSKGIIIFDLVGKIYSDYHVEGGVHHDFAQLSNGNIVVASSDADGETSEDVAQEIDLNTGEVVWRLDMKDILDQTDASCAASYPADWFHMNSVYYDDATESLLFTGRHVDSVVSVKYPEGTVNWILGDPSGWEKTEESLFFTAEGDGFEWFYIPHCASVARNGDILLFDNGGDRYKTNNADAVPTTGDDVYSRAVRYSIDTDNMTVQQVWEYGKERGREWFSSYISGVSEGDQDDTYWITSGGIIYKPSEDQFVKMTGDFEGIENQAYVDYVEGDTLVLEYFLKANVFRSTPLTTDQMVKGPMTLTNEQ